MQEQLELRRSENNARQFQDGPTILGSFLVTFLVSLGLQTTQLLIGSKLF